MTPLLFTTGWGALYLTVLVLLMGPSLLMPTRRWLALSMFLLFVCDRVAVNSLPAEVALFFLAFAYTLVAVAVTLTHIGGAARIMAGALLVTAIAFIAGGFGVIGWDTTATIQEICGLIAMLSIIFRRHNGGRSHAIALDDRVAGGGRDPARPAVAQRHARK